MALSAVISLKQSGNNVTIKSDNISLINRFISWIRENDTFYESYDNTFVFSEKKDFDECTAKAETLGLLPSV